MLIGGWAGCSSRYPLCRHRARPRSSQGINLPVAPACSAGPRCARRVTMSSARTSGSTHGAARRATPACRGSHGLQRPIDRDEDDDAQLYGELVSELKQARSSTHRAGRLRSCCPTIRPIVRTEGPGAATSGSGACCYPEWDYRAGCYVIQGARVREGQAGQGSRSWVEHTLKPTVR